MTVCIFFGIFFKDCAVLKYQTSYCIGSGWYGLCLVSAKVCCLDYFDCPNSFISYFLCAHVQAAGGIIRSDPFSLLDYQISGFKIKNWDKDRGLKAVGSAIWLKGISSPAILSRPRDLETTRHVISYWLCSLVACHRFLGQPSKNMKHPGTFRSSLSVSKQETPESAVFQKQVLAPLALCSNTAT